MARISFPVPQHKYTPGAEPTPWLSTHVDTMTIETARLRLTLFNRDGMAWQWVGANEDYAHEFPFASPNQMGYWEAVAMIELAEAQNHEPRRPWMGSMITLKKPVMHHDVIYPIFTGGQIVGVGPFDEGHPYCFTALIEGERVIVRDGDYIIV